VARGDVVVADRDGVVVLPAARFADVLTAGRARQQKEAGFLDRIRGGELTLDLYGFSRTGTAAR
jgi:4-hydroxy-4-methyl-2-oxoglutarate aldolase